MKNPQRVVDSNFDRIQARNGLVAKNLSQMTKLLPVLELSGKKEKNKELVQATLEARATALSEMIAGLTKSQKSLAKLGTEDKAGALRRVTVALKKVKTWLANKPPQGTSTHLRKIVNCLTSIREYIYVDSDGSTDSLKGLQSELSEYPDSIAEFKKMLKATHKKIQNLGAEGEEAEKEALIEQSYADMTRVLQETQVEATNLDALKTQPVVVTRASIIPIAKYSISIDKLKAQGFKVDNMGGYPVLRSQLVLGVSKTALNITEKERTKGKAIETSRVFEQAKKVKRQLEKQNKTKLFFVEEKPHGAQGGAWFWLMTERELNLFAQCFPGRAVQITRFGFAF